MLQVDRHLIAVAGVGFAAIETDLELGETVVALDSRGFVGVIATNHRLLGVGARSSQFAELRYRIAEKPVDANAVHVLDRVALVELHTRLVGFSAELGGWFELGLGPGEYPRRIDGEGGIAAMVTPRRAIAFSSRSSGFVEESLGPEEDVEGTTFSDASVTLILPHKILIFRAGDNRWSSLIR
ncbi:MAG: hypothetical protein ACHQ6T_03925 [Myxococcota bacterium]